MRQQHSYSIEAIILKRTDLGEADRVLTLFTPNKGKYHAIAKGIRRPISKKAGHLELLSHSQLQIALGRNLDIVTQAETLEVHRVLREDLDRLSAAVRLLEAVDQVAQERQPARRLYQMLLGALRALAARNAPLLVAAFELKLLSLEGFHPRLDACASCDGPGPLVGFDLGLGGALCRSCGMGAPVSRGALDAMGRILNGDLASALNEPAGPVSHEVEQLATRALEHHLERRLRAAHVLDRA